MNTQDSLAQRLLLLANCGEDLAFIFFDLDGKVTHWSRGAAEIFGRDAEETVGRDASVLFVPEDRERGMDVMEREIALRNPASEDDRWQLRGDGSRFWATGAMVALHEDGRHVGFGKVLRNRTDLKAQLESFRNAVQELEASARAKDVFLSTLSHELRNPLAPVANAVAILQQESAAPAQRDFALGVIERQMATLQRLVDDLLDLTRVGAGKIELKLSVHPLQDVVAAALESVEPLLAERRHTVHRLLPEEPIRVSCDFDRLVQVFVNLLTNAAKYTPPGGCVSVSLMIEGDEAAVRVEDNGIGIPSDMLPRIFDLFTQVESSLPLARGGLGIGLALVKNLVALQKGTVQVRSDGAGKGAQFTVRLPFAEPVRDTP